MNKSDINSRKHTPAKGFRPLRGYLIWKPLLLKKEVFLHPMFFCQFSLLNIRPVGCKLFFCCCKSRLIRSCCNKVHDSSNIFRVRYQYLKRLEYGSMGIYFQCHARITDRYERENSTGNSLAGQFSNIFLTAHDSGLGDSMNNYSD